MDVPVQVGCVVYDLANFKILEFVLMISLLNILMARFSLLNVLMASFSFMFGF